MPPSTPALRPTLLWSGAAAGHGRMAMSSGLNRVLPYLGADLSFGSHSTCLTASPVNASQAFLILTREENVIFRLGARVTAGRNPGKTKPPLRPPLGYWTARVSDIKFAACTILLLIGSYCCLLRVLLLIAGIHRVSRLPVGMGRRFCTLFLHDARAGEPMLVRKSRAIARFSHEHRFPGLLIVLKCMT